MPDTPGKRQRREVKAKRRQAKDERRTTRILRKDDPTAGMDGQPLLDENGFPVYDEDGYPVSDPVPRRGRRRTRRGEDRRFRTRRGGVARSNAAAGRDGYCGSDWI